MDDRIFLATEDVQPRRSIASFLSQVKDTRHMPTVQKRLLTARLSLFVLASLFLALFTYRTVHGQTTGVPVQPVISLEDARQDERIDTLTEFRHNQENYNRQIGDQLQHNYDALNEKVDRNTAAIASQNGIFTGCSALLALITGLSVFFQIKSSKPAPPQ